MSDIKIVINGKEKNRISKDVKKSMSQIIKEQTKNIQEFSIKINGRRPLPRCIKNMNIGEVEIIEISEATINPS